MMKESMSNPEFKQQAETLVQGLVCPPRVHPTIHSPGDYDMAYEDIKVTTEDGVELSAWVIKGSGKGVILMGHPGTMNKSGWSWEAVGEFNQGYKKNIEFVPIAKHLHNEGYSVVMYDQRNHGDSADTPKTGIINAVEAAKDVLAMTSYITEHPELKTQPFGIYSQCQNSMITLAALSRCPDFFRKADLKALITLQPMATRSLFEYHGFSDEMIDEIESAFDRRGIEMAALEPSRYFPSVSVPTMFVQAIMDPMSSLDRARDMYNSIPAEKEVFWIPGDLHRFDGYNYFGQHPERLTDFFRKYL